ncbi:PAS domain-containing protein, partial [Azospirillum humicireducens]
MLAAFIRSPHPGDLLGIEASALIDQIPTAVMLCQIPSFQIVYANPKSLELLRRISHLLKIAPEKVVGASIDIFHRHPEHQRKLLSDPKNLPFETQIRLGEETLNLHVTPVYDRGRYVAAMLTWNVVTEKVRADAEVNRLLRMLDEMPTAVMMCDPNDDFRITYINETSRRTLKPLEPYLPTTIDRLVGQSVDIFHKNPAHQRRIIGDPTRLPFNANIRVGPEVLNLRVTALNDREGRYQAAMLSWSVVTNNHRMADNVSKAVGSLVESAARMSEAAEQLVAAGGDASTLAADASAAIKEIRAAVGDIMRQMTTVSETAIAAVKEAEQSDKLAASLSQSARAIGQIVQIIASIAGQTNLLALNDG